MGFLNEGGFLRSVNGAPLRSQVEQFFITRVGREHTTKVGTIHGDVELWYSRSIWTLWRKGTGSAQMKGGLMDVVLFVFFSVLLNPFGTCL